MDRQTIEAAERVTAWCRARALSAVLAAPAMIAPAQAAHAEQQPLRERSAATSRYIGDAISEQLAETEDQQ